MKLVIKYANGSEKIIVEDLLPKKYDPRLIIRKIDKAVISAQLDLRESGGHPILPWRTK